MCVWSILELQLASTKYLMKALLILQSGVKTILFSLNGMRDANLNENDLVFVAKMNIL